MPAIQIPGTGVPQLGDRIPLTDYIALFVTYLRRLPMLGSLDQAQQLLPE